MRDFERYRGRKILVAMSGGVDSSLTAAALRLAGAEVIGVHMRVWHYRGCGSDDGLNGKIATCCSPADANDARRVAEQYDFPFYSIDYETDFRRAVIDPFVKDYLAGRTPNPCVSCNSKLKLGSLLARARAYGADAVATGHFARVRHDAPGGRVELRRAADRAKDQSYYLFELRQPQFAGFETPLGEMTKSEVREMARELGLGVAEKPDSQEICFVTDNDYRRFLREEAGVDESALGGDIIDTAGRKLGRHAGVHNFTIGQRKGIGVSSEHPLYVVDILPESGVVVVGGPEDVTAPGLVAAGWNWVGLEPTTAPLRARVRIRYRHEPVPASLRVDESGRAEIDFDEPQRAVTPGQAVVAYDIETGESVVGGGWIERKTDTPAPSHCDAEALALDSSR